jgi:predicted XRE-type DNA-binding protein
MATDWEELRSELQRDWSEDDRRVYDAVSASFQAEMKQHARLGAQVAAARKARCLTQNELARLSEIQQAEISRIERGGNPTASTLVRLAEALGQQFVLVPARPSPRLPSSSACPRAI